MVTRSQRADSTAQHPELTLPMALAIPREGRGPLASLTRQRKRQENGVLTQTEGREQTVSSSPGQNGSELHFITLLKGVTSPTHGAMRHSVAC